VIEVVWNIVAGCVDMIASNPVPYLLWVVILYLWAIHKMLRALVDRIVR
jgi:hypothetical protein